MWLGFDVASQSIMQLLSINEFSEIIKLSQRHGSAILRPEFSFSLDDVIPRSQVIGNAAAEILKAEAATDVRNAYLAY